MLDEYTHIQAMADQLKALVHRAKVSKYKEQQTVRLINKIERAGWHARAMQRALDETAPGRFGWQDKRLTFAPSGEDNEDVATYVQRVIRRYAELIEHELFGDVMGIQDAALYLETSVIALNKAIYRAGALKAQKLGHDLMFTRQQLDEYKATRKVGRPKQKVLQAEEE